MIKRFAHTLLFFMSIQTVLHASAYNFESGGICYIIDGNARTASVADEKHSGPLTIPAFVTYYGTDYAVTAIDLNLFFSCEDLTSITVDSENRAYASVDGVLYNKDITVLIKCPEGKTSVEIPESVTSIENFAFYNCCNLTSITVDSENKAYASADGVLYDKDITELIKCPEGKTSVEIPGSVTTIRNEAFDNCSNLTSIKIPESVTDIGYAAFYNCHSLSSIAVDNANKTYVSVDGVLYDKDITVLIKCPEGKTSVEIPKSVTYIGDHAFHNCSNLTSVKIPKSVTTIEIYAFSDCSNLTSVKIPESVTTIENYAFSDCSNLTSVKIPKSVTDIGYGAFHNCLSLSSITVDNANKAYVSVDGVLYDKDITVLIKCPEGKTSVEIPKSVTTIEGHAFSDCSNLTSVKIPESVTYIGYHAFHNCLSLSSITVDNANKAYASVDGVLYNKDMTKLIADPTYKMQSGTTESESDF